IAWPVAPVVITVERHGAPCHGRVIGADDGAGVRGGAVAGGRQPVDVDGAVALAGEFHAYRGADDAGADDDGVVAGGCHAFSPSRFRCLERPTRMARGGTGVNSAPQVRAATEPGAGRLRTTRGRSAPPRRAGASPRCPGRGTRRRPPGRARVCRARTGGRRRRLRRPRYWRRAPPVLSRWRRADSTATRRTGCRRRRTAGAPPGRARRAT